VAVTEHSGVKILSCTEKGHVGLAGAGCGGESAGVGAG
jgi:hypothetical protein